MSFFAAFIPFLNRHAESLEEIALIQANGKIMSIGLKLGRVRTHAEQVNILTEYYSETLRALDEFDENGISSLYFVNHALLEHGRDDLHTISDTAQRLHKVFDGTGIVDEFDFEGIMETALENIPKDHALYSIIEAYKNFRFNEHFLAGINELLDILDSNQNGEKLTDEQVDQHANKNTTVLTNSQKVLAVDYLMRESGIEIAKGQAAKQHRFISSITKIGQADVAKKFPPKGEAPFNQTYIDNLRPLIDFFDGIGAKRVVSRIKADITWEEEKTEF